MKEILVQLIETAVQSLRQEGILPADWKQTPGIENTRDKAHGDFASNIALIAAKPAGMRPRDLAEKLVSALPEHRAVSRVEIAGPGFINFFLSDASNFSIIETILDQTESFGRSSLGKGQRIQVEFVSANPTGPLHVGHGRGAAYGATVADLLAAVGYEVQREYYVNDAGRQMNILAVSVWLRYLELAGETLPFPSNGYRGQYVREIARQLQDHHGRKLVRSAAEVFDGLVADAPAGGDKEAHIDALVERCRELIGESDYRQVFDLGLNAILDDIRDDLEGFGVHYQEWFSERSLQAQVAQVIERLQQGGFIYEQDGALWFRSTEFGDDKDRVVRRDNGETTYFASDIAYHLNKFERGFDRVINVWGADHHGYIARVKAALQALGIDPDRLDVRLVQFAILYRGSERVQMSTRSGSFVTLRELRDEVGNDAARFFYVTRKAEQHMDFDLELAKTQSKDNPVYYIQYAHARICSMLRKLRDAGEHAEPARLARDLTALELDEERDLATQLARYPEVLSQAAVNLEPHHLTHYLRELAGQFHTYYNAHKVLVEDQRLRDARVALCIAVRQVLANALSLLGVSAPEEM